MRSEPPMHEDHIKLLDILSDYIKELQLSVYDYIHKNTNSNLTTKFTIV